MAYVNVLPKNMAGETEENHIKLKSAEPG